MYIRKTTIKQNKTGTPYSTYRIVESQRVGKQVKQFTLLNLGKHFSLTPDLWSELCHRIEDIIHGQNSLFDMVNTLGEDFEKQAQLYAKRIIEQLSEQPTGSSDVTPSIPFSIEPISSLNDGDLSETSSKTTDHQTLPSTMLQNPHMENIDINQIETSRSRSIGAEAIAVHAVKQLELDKYLKELGLNGRDLSAILGLIVARMVHPSSELSTHRWLQEQSALGELLDCDFSTISLTRLYRSLDRLHLQSSNIEEFLYKKEQNLFHLESHIILFDLTNTFFEGQANQNSKAQFGRSKEKRTDCPLVTLGLVIDEHGFPMRSRIFSGNISEPKTLEDMIGQLNQSSPVSPIVVMDAGIATEDNLIWLTLNKFRYLVVSRKRELICPSEACGAVVVKEIKNQKVIVQRQPVTESSTSEDSKNRHQFDVKKYKSAYTDEEIESATLKVETDIRFYCHSELKEKKETSIKEVFKQRLEKALELLNAGLSKKGCTKTYEKVLMSVGKIKQRYSSACKFYHIEVVKDETSKNASQIIYSPRDNLEKNGTEGVYCLRTNVEGKTEDEIWNTYTMLTELEATFGSMKGHLGLRPVFHHLEKRVDSHLFITLLAYHLVHTIRYQLKQADINDSWETIRETMTTQQRVTVTAPLSGDRRLYLRTTTEPETKQRMIYKALQMSAQPVAKSKTIISTKSTAIIEK